jgi:hypothetical protein
MKGIIRVKKRHLLLTLLFSFSAFFSLAASPIAPGFSEKVHIRVHNQNTSNLHQADQLNSVELHQVTEDFWQYDALGSTVRPGSGGNSYFYKGKWRNRATGRFDSASHSPNILSKIRGYSIHQGKRAHKGISRLGTRLKRYLHIEDHHLINQATLKGKNPHALITAADELGVDIIRSKWNIKTMFHNGNHVTKYYDSVRDRLDVVYQRYLKDGANWSTEIMEAELKSVAKGIRSDIFWLKLRLY